MEVTRASIMVRGMSAEAQADFSRKLATEVCVAEARVVVRWLVLCTKPNPWWCPLFIWKRLAGRFLDLKSIPNEVWNEEIIGQFQIMLAKAEKPQGGLKA